MPDSYQFSRQETARSTVVILAGIAFFALDCVEVWLERRKTN